MKELREKIEQEIRKRGPIPFSRYMEACLYDEEFGYYSRNASQFGKAGDFFTSSDVHAVFGRLLARQFDEMWRVLGSPSQIAIHELGPGRGLFAQDVLDWSEKKFPGFFRALQYVLVERSPALRQKIQENLSAYIRSGKVRLDQAKSAGIEDAATAARPKSPAHGASRGPEAEQTPAQEGRKKDSMAAPTVLPFPAAERPKNPARGASRGTEAEQTPAPEGRKKDRMAGPTILFANEFFDALPVEIVSSQGSLRIDSRNRRFTETWAPSSAEELEFLDRYSVHPEEAERIEVPLQALQQTSGVAGFERGFVIVIDYGYTRDEQLAGRHRGTLKAIRQHSVSTNAYEAPGEQDITADVNFTAIGATLEAAGVHPQRLVTQSQFLMGIGELNEFADAFEDCRLPQERAKVALQLKHLVTPAGMGESFHVLVASKGVATQDAGSLAGLSFGKNAMGKR